MTPRHPPSEPSLEQLTVLTHLTRQQVWAQLAHGPSTVSGLARRLAVNKGNIAHHLAVLERVGLVSRGLRRTVRGGTEQLFERKLQHLRTVQPGQTVREVNATILASVGLELGEDPERHLHLRRLRLTARQADAVAGHLDGVLQSLTPAGANEQEYGVMVGLWRRPNK